MLSDVGVNVERAFIKRGPFINGAAWRVAGAAARGNRECFISTFACFPFFRGPRRRQVAHVY